MSVGTSQDFAKFDSKFAGARSAPKFHRNLRSRVKFAVTIPSLHHYIIISSLHLITNAESLLDSAWLSAQELNAKLADPDYQCGSAEVGGIWRSNCRWPFRCCSTWRPPHTLTEHGSPLSRATPPSTPDSRSTLGSTVVDTPPGASPSVYEVAPPTPGADVERDPEHPYMPTPVRANQVTTTTPADSDKKAGANESHPANLN